MGLTSFLLSALVAAAPNPLLAPDAPNPCKSCAAWNRPHPPVHVFGNTWWVGVEGLSAIAIDTGEGVILIDGALPQSAPLIKASLAEAGLKLSGVKIIVNSHAHFDHAGGIDALQRASGARVLASPQSAQVFRSGCDTKDDPQYGFGCGVNGFPPVKAPVETLRDGQVIELGKVSLQAHFTPAHTPGSTSWTWQSCEGARCLNIVYADSLSAVSSDGFRFTPAATAFLGAVDRVAALPCDVLLTPHPDASWTLERLSNPANAGTGDRFASGECAKYAATARQRFNDRLASEARPAAKH